MFLYVCVTCQVLILNYFFYNVGLVRMFSNPVSVYWIDQDKSAMISHIQSPRLIISPLLSDTELVKLVQFVRNVNFF